MEHFGERLRQVLKERRMSQQALANRAMISETSVYFYINKNVMPSAVYLRQICEVLNVSADYLLGLEENQNAKIH